MKLGPPEGLGFINVSIKGVQKRVIGQWIAKTYCMFHAGHPQQSHHQKISCSEMWTQKFQQKNTSNKMVKTQLFPG